MNAAQILAIAKDQPERLFKDRHGLADQYKALAKSWHPDLHPGEANAVKVFQHIGELFARAKEKVAAGEWSPLGAVELSCTDGKLRKIRFKRRVRFELGEILYGPTMLAFVVKQEFADLFHDAEKMIGSFHYANGPMKSEMEKYLPKIVRRFETKSGQLVMQVEKTDDVYLLSDIVSSFNDEKLDPKHVAWILNGIYNIACYLQYAEISHGAIAMDTIFISPKFHSVMLYGGWWYAHDFKSKINALPARSHRLASPEILKSKMDYGRLDLFLIRALGRELLGDSSGMKLARSAVPEQMVRFLRMPGGRSAREDYFHWGENLKSIFGSRRFVEMDFNESDIFTKE